MNTLPCANSGFLRRAVVFSTVGISLVFLSACGTRIRALGEIVSRAGSSLAPDTDPPIPSTLTIMNGNPTRSLTYTLSFGPITGTYDYYCILENSTDINGCGWVAGAVPPSLVVSTTENAKTFSAWLKDAAGNISVEVDSNTVSLDRTAPNAGTALTWSPGSPMNSTSVTASWTKSTSPDLADQSVQFYSGGACGAVSGGMIPLGSSSAQTYGWTAPFAGTFSYRITSSDAAGNTATSACSSPMVIDQSAPNAATALGWLESTPRNSTSATAAWTKSTSLDVANETIRFYSDAGCTAPSGASINLASSTAQSYAWTAPGSGTYAYILTTVDTAGNTTASGCSTTMVIDVAPPAASTAIAWVEASPHGSTSLTAGWTKSASGDLANQKIQFYADASCTTPSGGLVDLASATVQIRAFVAPGAGTYTYTITSFDGAGNSALSACSSAMVIDLTAPAVPTNLAFSAPNPTNALGVTVTWTKSTASDVLQQTVAFYNFDCSVAVTGALGPLAPGIETYGWTAPSAGIYGFKVAAQDTAGNFGLSACSAVPVTIDQTAPAAATAVAWLEATPSPNTSITATWAKSASGDLANQKLQFFSDGACGTPTGGLVNLASATAQSFLWASAGNGFYSFKVTSYDAAGNSAPSLCSGSLEVNSTAPENATGLGWSQATPRSSTSVTAAWTKSIAGDLANQKIQFYSDSGCSVPSGGLVDLASAVTQTYAWTAPGEGTFAYKITSIDTGTNTSVSNCSSAMVIDSTAPADATSLVWGQSSPRNTTGLTANWTKSVSADLNDQWILFFSDGTCGTALGGYILLGSATQQSYAWTAPGAGTYSFSIYSRDAALNGVNNTCSGAMVIDTTAPALATGLGWVQASPSASTSVTPTWTVSTDAGISTQKIRLYGDGTCGSAITAFVDLASTTAATYAWTASAEGTYSFVILTQDAAGNTSTTGCSPAMVIDTTPPPAATGLGWAETSPRISTSVNATWTPPGGIADQSFQLYSDSSCTTPSGAVDTAPGAATTTVSKTLSGEGTFTYKIRTIDAAGNGTWSACSSPMVIDQTHPDPATALGWVGVTPRNTTGATASWTKSISTDLAAQAIQFYSDSGCVTLTGTQMDVLPYTNQTYAWTAPGAGTFAYKIISFDGAGNGTTSACSSPMVIDLTAPAAATALAWSQTSPFNSTSVTATWTKSVSVDIFDQSIRFFTDGTCATAASALIGLTAADQTYAWTAPSAGTYYFTVYPKDNAGNTTTSACSPAMVIDLTAPTNPTLLGWQEVSPNGTTAITAAWTKSVSGDLANQKIQFYADGACGTVSGAEIDLASAATQIYAWTAPGIGTYTYKLRSIDTAANESLSACSAAMVVDPIPVLASVTITNATPTTNSTYSLTYGAADAYNRWCILENDTTVGNCVWNYGTLPASKVVKSVVEAKTFSVWIKSASNLTSARVASNSVTYSPAVSTAWDRGTFDFQWTRLKTRSMSYDYRFENKGLVTTSGCSAPILTGANPTHFSIVTDGCGATQQASGETCLVSVSFTPTTVGAKTATLRRTCAHGQTNVTLNGTARAAYPTKIAAGGFSTSVVLSDGAGVSFGANYEGYLGTWDIINYRMPHLMQYDGSPTYVSGIQTLDLGYSHGCFLKTTGTVECFGESTYGQSGAGVNSTTVGSPLDTGLTGITKIAMGYRTACAVKSDNTLYCWGQNDNREVLNTATGTYNTPQVRPGIAAIDVGAGQDHTCAVLTDNTVNCWGLGAYGRLGNGSTSNNFAGVAVTGIANAVEVETAYTTSCALLSDKTVKCWGEAGRNGDGSNVNKTTPVVVTGLSNVEQITSGREHFCARTSAGDVYCWGENLYGEVQPGDRAFHYSAVRVAGITGATYISASESRHTCALTAGQTIKCWGNNFLGQLGTGDNPFRTRFVHHGSSLAGVASAVQGDGWTCAVMTDKTMKCWGNNSWGVLGDGTQVSNFTPTTVAGLANVEEAVAGIDQICVRLTDGSVKCWGRNTYGGVGSGAIGATILTPTTVAGVSGVAALAGGHYHVCAALTGGTVKCWGFNANSQLGNGGTANSVAPVVATGATGVTQIAAGQFHTCARKSDGTALCWGDNSQYAMGDGTTTNATVPQAVPQLTGVTKLAIGWRTTCALLTDQNVKCWGTNSWGETGDGTAAVVTTPKLSGVAGIVDIAISGRTSFFLEANGTIRGNGDNQGYQLADGTTNIPGAGYPKFIVGSRPYASLQSSGQSIHPCALTAGGTLYCWGSNDYFESNWTDSNLVTSWSSELVDDFNDGVFAPNWQNASGNVDWMYGSTTVAESGGGITFTLANNDGYAGVVTTANYDFTGGSFQVETTTPAPNTAGACAPESGIDIEFSLTNGYSAELYKRDTFLYGQIQTAGIWTNAWAPIAYSAVNHRFLRIRHDPNLNVISYEASADGLVWNQIGSSAPPMAVTTARPMIYSGPDNIACSAGAGIARFDNAIIEAPKN